MNAAELDNLSAPLQYCDNFVGNQAIAQVILQMKKAINGKVTLDEWADYASVSKYRLTTLFKLLTGIPPITFHNAEKIEIAKRLLVFESMSVTDVCFEIGFESMGSFVAKFSNSVGIPPGRYSREMQNTKFVQIFSALVKNSLSRQAGSDQKLKVHLKRPPEAGSSLLIAALFDRPFPSGYPLAWRCISPFANTFSLAVPQIGYCLLASLPRFPDLSELVNFCPVLVGRTRIEPDVDATSVQLRTPTLFDPPVTLAVPALFNREISQACNLSL